MKNEHKQLHLELYLLADRQFQMTLAIYKNRTQVWQRHTQLQIQNATKRNSSVQKRIQKLHKQSTTVEYYVTEQNTNKMRK